MEVIKRIERTGGKITEHVVWKYDRNKTALSNLEDLIITYKLHKSTCKALRNIIRHLILEINNEIKLTEMQRTANVLMLKKAESKQQQKITASTKQKNKKRSKKISKKNSN